MLQTIRKFRKSIGAMIIVGCVAMVMTGFGMETYLTSRDTNAMTIGERKVSYDEFYRERRRMEESYRRMLGKNYAQMAEALNLNVGQQVVEKLVNDTLIEKEARELGLHTGNSELRKTILNMFGGQGKFDPVVYDSYLRQSGLTAKGFEDELRTELLRVAYQQVLSDLSRATERETRSSVEHDNTSYRVGYAEIDPAKFVEKVPEPSDETLQKYYGEHATDYETVPAVSYDYAVISPNELEAKVEVLPEDLELYYSENESQFKAPAELKVQHIQMNYLPRADPTQMANLKETAQGVHAKVQAGEDFANLALLNSDDITTKSLGGELGWIQRGKMAKEFDDAVFQLQTPGVAELVATNYGFHIVKVLEVKPERLRSFDEVKGEIEKLIRKREAPAYASARAHELFSGWQKGDKGLSALAEESGLTSKSSEGALTKDKDPESLKGLTERILTFPNDKKQLIELADRSVLVEIQEHMPSDVPAFAEVKPRVLEAYKKIEAGKLADAAANKMLDDIKAKTAPDLAAAAQAAGVEAKETAGLVPTKEEKTAPFSDPSIRKSIFTALAPQPPSKVLASAGKLYLFEVRELAKPAARDIAPKIEGARQQENQRLAQVAIESALNRMKSATLVDYDEKLLVQER